MIIKFLQFLKGNAIITLLIIGLLGATLFSFHYIGVLKDVIYEQQYKIEQAQIEIQTERHLRDIDGKTYKKLQEEKARLESQRRETDAIINGLNDNEKNIINQPIPDSIKRVFN